MKNEWIVIEVSVPGSAVDLVSAILTEYGCGGVVVEERQLDTFVVPDVELEATASYRLKAYFESVADAQQLRTELLARLQSLPALAGKIVVGFPAPVRMEDWAENWKQNFTTLKVGSRLIIRPSWEDYQPKSDEVVIEIDPGMAFGTGTHGTTLLCLEMIAELLAQPSAPQSFLDVGTGSGILALGAAALGCREILANDIDAEACSVARGNVAKNGFSDNIRLSEQPLENLSGQFELVVANILAEENVRLKNELLQHLSASGWLVLSGILREKEALVREGFADLPLDSFPSRYQDDWVCLLYRKQG
jgi:ribosomal protein L11 methyltransferase